MRLTPDAAPSTAAETTPTTRAPGTAFRARAMDSCSSALDRPAIQRSMSPRDACSATETSARRAAASSSDPLLRRGALGRVHHAGRRGPLPLHPGELGRLARADIEPDERRAWVVSSGSRGHNKARRLRSVALSQRALQVLEQLPKRKDGLVFGPIPDPRRTFAAAAKAAGLERVWLHLMRHQASRIGRAGAGMADLMAFGGWNSPRMVQRYTHSDHYRRQVELVDRAAGGAPQAPKPDGTPQAVPQKQKPPGRKAEGF